MKYLILLLLLSSGCYSQKRAIKDIQRAQLTYPDLFKVGRDTIWSTEFAEIPPIEFDEEFWRNRAERDSFAVVDSTGKMRTIVVYTKGDVLTKWRIITKVERDTAIIRIPVVTVKTEVKTVSYIPKWVWMVIGGLVMVSIISIIIAVVTKK